MDVRTDGHNSSQKALLWEVFFFLFKDARRAPHGIVRNQTPPEKAMETTHSMTPHAIRAPVESCTTMTRPNMSSLVNPVLTISESDV